MYSRSKAKQKEAKFLPGRLRKSSTTANATKWQHKRTIEMESPVVVATFTYILVNSVWPESEALYGYKGPPRTVELSRLTIFGARVAYPLSRCCCPKEEEKASNMIEVKFTTAFPCPRLYGNRAIIPR